MQDEVYPGKTRYESQSVAGNYDSKRFKSFKGRMTDKLEKYWIKKAFKTTNLTGTILDVPCGTGRMTEMFLKMGYLVHVADISKNMMKYAILRTQQYADNVNFEICDIEELPFAEESFELILTFRLIHHLPSNARRKILKQLYNVSKRWVLLSFSNKYTIQSVRRGIKAKFNKEARYSISPSIFRNEINKAGFNIVKYYPILPIFSETVVVLLEKDQE